MILWGVLDGDEKLTDSGRTTSRSQAMLDLFAALRRQSADAEVYGLVWDGDTGEEARFDRLRPGCYWQRRP